MGGEVGAGWAWQAGVEANSALAGRQREFCEGNAQFRRKGKKETLGLVENDLCFCE